MFAALFCDGHLTIDALRPECIAGKWAPVATIAATRSIILFPVQEIVYKFCKRNYPKNWMAGAVFMTDDDFKWIADKGLTTEVWDFPRKLPLEQFSFEIIELGDEPDLVLVHKNTVGNRPLQV